MRLCHAQILTQLFAFFLSFPLGCLAISVWTCPKAEFRNQDILCKEFGMHGKWLMVNARYDRRKREREMSQKMFINFKCCWQGLHSIYVGFDNIKGRWL